MRIEAIVPKNNLLKGDLQRLMRKAVDQTRDQIETSLNRITDTWTTKVKFKIRLSNEQGNLVVDITTTNNIFRYVNEGTKPHIIRAKNAPYLRFFASGFAAKTKPGRLTSGTGAKANSDFRQVKQVDHPGTKARNYTRLIAKKYAPKFQGLMKTAIQRAVKGR